MDSPSESGGESSQERCPICYLELVQPIRLPCSHIFCFLCAKGAIMSSEKCSICRHPIPRSFFNDNDAIMSCTLHPAVARPVSAQGDEMVVDDGEEVPAKWLYQGYNGWWLYDSRSSEEIENTYEKKEQQSFEMLIAGHMYVIDFANMVQYRKSNPSIKRTIKRDADETNIKGVAGVPFQH